ncbi:MAG: autotransporter domain-containing protein [Verrucomicrobia bacterium]|nr:autotransporter domain-containing protein [Verrucomicrobiota bacterium]
MKHLKASFLLAAAGASIHVHGAGGGNYSSAHAVSADGAVVVGEAGNDSNEYRAFRWTRGVMTDLGTLGGYYSYPSAVSADGAVVVGYAYNASNQQRAFHWTRGVMTDLGTLGGSISYADAVSSNGAVVVGRASNDSNEYRAFRWTGGVMTDLGTLGGNYSDANAVSADGAVVVGQSYKADNEGRAFRWTGGVMTDLGTLGGNRSCALAVSANGAVVVGSASNASDESHAFRWAGGVMTDLGTLLGGTYSESKAVSANGAVVVGFAKNASDQDRAFRWASGVMTDLGTFGGNESSALAVSADGAVVVGAAYNASNKVRAFRWKDGVMTDLGTLGGNESYALAVSADGAVVVGAACNASNESRAFIYTNRGMLDVQDWLSSVGGVHSTLSTGLELSRTFMEGAHHRPLAELGRGRSYWATGDIAGSSRSRDLITRSGEAGATFEPWTNVLIGIGAGYGVQDQKLGNGGSASTYGQYLVGEVDFIRPNGGIFSVLVSAGDWRANMDRGYVTGGGVDYSHGVTDLQSTSVRLRYDTAVLAKASGAEIKAYLSGSLSKAQSDAYSETGGSYAGNFGELEQTAKEGRLGVAATRSFTEKLRGRLSVEWIRRFDSDQAVLTATDITSTLDLSPPGAPVVRDQARFGFDLDYLMDAKTTASFTIHASGVGESPDVSGAISLRRAF